MRLNTASKVILGLAVVLLITARFLTLDNTSKIEKSSDQPISETQSTNKLTQQLSFYGPHQAGITTPIQPYALYLGVNLNKNSRTPDDVESVLRLLSDDIASLMSAQPVLGTDPAPMIASSPASISINVGVGASTFKILSLNPPAALNPLPAFDKMDNLDPKFNTTDFVLTITAADQLVLAHAARVITHDLSTLVDTIWTQQGFRGSAAPLSMGEAHRTLMGWVEGIESPDPADYDQVIWSKDDPLTSSGTYLALRRIQFDMDKWEALDPQAQVLVIGRTRDDSVPLSGKAASDKADCSARDANGLTKIPSSAHICAVNSQMPDHSRDAGALILRRTFNFLTPNTTSNPGESGLIFASYTNDPQNIFLPMLKGLNQSDSLNAWSKHTGSALYFILPGATSGHILGEELLNASRK